MNRIQKKKRTIEQKIALFLAVMLVGLSVITAFRHAGIFQSSDDVAQVSAAAKDDQATDDNSEIAEKAATNTIEKKEQPLASETEIADQAKSDSDASESEQKSTEQVENQDSETYSYVAEAGDSYTEFARTAVSEYAKEKQLELSDIDRLTAEIELTNDANAPLLEIGQEVAIKKDAVAAVVSASEANQEVASTDQDNNEASDTEKAEEPQPTEDDSVSVKTGDSYTSLVRSAVAKALEKNGETLNAAQKVAAETYVAEAAAFPEIEVDQQISISADDVKQAIEKATALSSAEQTAWQVYADSVVF